MHSGVAPHAAQQARSQVRHDVGTDLRPLVHIAKAPAEMCASCKAC